jgi:hypothetical protein
MDKQNGSSKVLMLVFWAYVLIPLVWGVSKTIANAAKLFH